MTRSTRLARNPKLPKRSKWFPWLLSIVLSVVASFFILMMFVGYDAWKQWMPSDEMIDFDFHGKDKPVYFQGELQPESAMGEGDGLMLPLSMMHSIIDPHIYYEEETNTIIITTMDKVLQFETEQLTAMVNNQSIDLQFPIQEVDGKIYIPIHPLIELYDIRIEESSETGAVIIAKEGDAIQWGSVVLNEDAPLQSALRTRPHIKSPRISQLEKQSKVMILREQSGWYEVLIKNGFNGYIRKDKVLLEQVEVVSKREKESSFIAWKPLGEKINLTWEAVYNVPADPKKMGKMPGLNVVSPTWFDLQRKDDGELYVANKADLQYVNWAHQRNYQVWGLFSNSFDPEWTSELLKSYDNRMKIINELLYYAKLYNLQGINIDFENVYLSDKDLLTQFVREMTPLLHEQNLVVSMDVTIRGGSPQWSLFYDRRELGKVIDYMMVMTYDEHWAASPIAGSVASLPWVEKGLVDIMEHDAVSASKLIVGVPFYTRIWTEEIIEGQTKVSSSAVSMSYIERVIKENKLEPVFQEETGQYYTEYIEDGKLRRIWIENADSMKRRAALVNKYDLAGIASWRRGFETPDIWSVIDEELSKIHE